MSSISIIGTGNMASALAGRALAGGNAVEIVGRDPVKAKELAAALGGATVGMTDTAPAGDIVILAVPYASAAAVIGQYGDSLPVTSPTGPESPLFFQGISREKQQALGFGEIIDAGELRPGSRSRRANAAATGSSSWVSEARR